jgi:hypothetical protein
MDPDCRPPAKALKSLAPQLKNRFTSCAHFPREHSSMKAIRGQRLRISARTFACACSNAASAERLMGLLARRIAFVIKTHCERARSPITRHGAFLTHRATIR